MAIVCNKVHSSKWFRRDEEDPNLLTAWASDLQPARVSFDSYMFGRVFDDACDEGFILKGEKTGAEVLFTVWHVEIKDDDNDIRWWELRPYKYKKPLNDATKELRVIVWNT